MFAISNWYNSLPLRVMTSIIWVVPKSAYHALINIFLNYVNLWNRTACSEISSCRYSGAGTTFVWMNELSSSQCQRKISGELVLQVLRHHLLDTLNGVNSPVLYRIAGSRRIMSHFLQVRDKVLRLCGGSHEKMQHHTSLGTTETSIGC